MCLRSTVPATVSGERPFLPLNMGKAWICNDPKPGDLPVKVVCYGERVAGRACFGRC